MNETNIIDVEQLMSQAEVLREFGISRQLVQHWINRGKVLVVVVAGKRLLRRDSVGRYVGSIRKVGRPFGGSSENTVRRAKWRAVEAKEQARYEARMVEILAKRS